MEMDIDMDMGKDYIVDQAAKKIWDYHHMNHSLEKADCILVLGSHDERVAECGARLYLDEWAPLIIFSGYLGHLTKDMWIKSEAERFAEIALKMGVPKKDILIENKSTNTGENITFTRQLLTEKGLDLNKFIVVQKPYMERRSYATFKKVWSEKDIIITSPKIAFEDYFTESIKKEDVIGIMVGDLQRIKVYADNGYQIYQEIPTNVWKAFKELVDYGFTDHLIN